MKKAPQVRRYSNSLRSKRGIIVDLGKEAKVKNVS